MIRVKEESEKAGLKLDIKKLKHRREKVEVVTDFIFLGSKITAGCDYSHEIKRHLEGKL